MKNNNRYLESLTPHFVNELTEKVKTLILCSSNDEGVIRNKGRNGQRYAPVAIINVLKKLNNHIDSSLPCYTEEVFEQSEEVFEAKQKKSSEKIASLIAKHLKKNILHLGGGHDHAYPFLIALELNDKIKNILILNIDAHCDTRIDDKHHSGTPFRDFAESTNKNVHLIQYGIHNYANSDSTLTPLANIKEKHFSLSKIKSESKNFNQLPTALFDHLPFPFGDDTFIYLSLDCDALESSIMEAVSAVNHEGIPLSHVQLLIDKVKTLQGPKAFGIYEYNPLYDNLSQKGARAICSLIYNWLSH